MDSWVWIGIRIILLHVPITAFIRLATAEPNLVNHFCVNTGNYTNTTSYQTNLNNLLSSLSSIVDQYGFSNSTAGQDPDQVHALVLCRGDVDVDSCRSCTIYSVSRLPALCPGYKDAILWYDICMLRYSSRSITGFISTGQHFFLVNPYNATSMTQFNAALMKFLTHLRTTAAAGGPLRKFVAGNTTGPDFQKIYALVQCTPDLSEDLCNDCLKRAMSEIPVCCDGKVGVRVFYPSCTLWSENYPFFDEIAVQALSPPPPWPPVEVPPPPSSDLLGKRSNKNRTAMIGVAVSISFLGILILIISIWFIFSRRRKQRRPIQNVKTVDGMSTFETLQYTTDTIRAATNDFSEENKLGQGGFGAVYQGKLSNGQDVAVKQLCRGGGQGEEEFKNELVLLANLQHRNLVRILGFCLQGTDMFLVYELVANSSLDRFLFDPVKRAQLDWRKRYKIILGIARGILYLHEDSRLRIIHRDLKASNILLDAAMNAKISDFGMARLFAMDETRGNTRRIAGTYGYMAPEYALHGQFSVKSDVFSFGVLILEIVSGKKNSHDNGDHVEHLLSNVWRSWREQEGDCNTLIEPVLRDHTDTNGDNDMMMMKRCIHTGLLCCQEIAEIRPTMASVVQMLSNFNLTSLPPPSKPGFYFYGHGGDDIDGLNGNSQQDSISHVHPR